MLERIAEILLSNGNNSNFSHQNNWGDSHDLMEFGFVIKQVKVSISLAGFDLKTFIESLIIEIDPQKCKIGLYSLFLY